MGNVAFANPQHDLVVCAGLQLRCLHEELDMYSRCPERRLSTKGFRPEVMYFGEIPLGTRGWDKSDLSSAFIPDIWWSLAFFFCFEGRSSSDPLE